MNPSIDSWMKEVFGLDNVGSCEDLTEANFYIPSESEYEDFDEETEDICAASLWENIRKKKEREGKNYKPAKPGDPDRPEKDAFKKAQSAEYQGKKVTLNKPFRTPKESKKFAVYVKNKSGKVVVVRFGDQNMEIKKDNPERRKNFKARHNCSEKKDKTTPGYWSCHWSW